MQQKQNQLIYNIPICKLKRGIFQTRTNFDAKEIKELADSFLQHGIIQPLVVRKLDDDNYEIIAGERRWRAAQVAAMDTVPCLLKEYNDEKALAVTTIENLQRANLNPIEEAHAFAKMIASFSYSHDEISAIVCKSRSYITNSLRLLKLDSKVQELLAAQELSIGHAKAIASLPLSMQYKLSNEAITANWSVRKLETKVKSLISNPYSKNSNFDKDITRLEPAVSEELGAPVKIEMLSDKTGWLKLKFFNADTLEGILDKMGLEYE